MAYGEEEIPGGFVRVMAVIFAVIADHMVSDDRVDLHFAEEATVGFDDAEEQDAKRDTDCCVDAVLNAGKDGHKNTGKKDDHFYRRDAPELVERVRGRDEVPNCVNDDSGQTGVGNIEEDRCQGIDGEENDKGSKDTGKRGSHAGFRLDGCPRERASGWVSSQKWAK